MVKVYLDVAGESKCVVELNDCCLSCQFWLNRVFRIRIITIIVAVEDHRLHIEVLLDIWQSLDNDLVQQEPLRDGNTPLKQLFEVEQVPQLTGLRDSFSVFESLPPIIDYRIGCRISKSTVHQVTTDKGSGPALTSVAVNGND